jgi:hypothetical protein
MNAYNRRENLTPRSQLLDEFRMNKSARWQLTVCPLVLFTRDIKEEFKKADSSTSEVT